MTDILRYSGLRKSVHGRLLFDIETLAIQARACLALSGRNGSGKSTLLRIIAGLEAPDRATVCYRGKEMSWRRASCRMRGEIIYLHQQPYLFDSSVTDNIAYGLRRRSLPLKEISHKVSEALSKGWALHGSPVMAFDAARGVMRCGQAVVKEVPGDYSPDLKLGEQ